MFRSKSIIWSLNGVHLIAMSIMVPCLIWFGVHIKKTEMKRKADFRLSRESVNIVAQLNSNAPNSAVQLNNDRHWFSLWDANGALITRTANAQDVRLPAHITKGLNKQWIGQSRVHFYQLPNTNHILTVGLPRGPIDAKVTRMRNSFILGSFILLPLIIFLSHRSAKRALSPIKDMTRIASAISNGDYKQRLDALTTKSELQELAKILNQAFDHIDHTLEIQRKFTSNASHELRTPISILLLELESAIDNDLPKDELDNRLQHCVSTAKKMEHLANSMLKIARLESGEIQLHKVPVDLATVIETNLNSLRSLTEQKSIQLKHALQPLEVEIDTDSFAQIITNLISNAVSHTPEGGSINVKLEEKNSFAEITISDTGSGIPAADLPHIFNRFYRADKARAASANEESRSGLGLAICQSIIHAHNGTIHIDSTEGEGTTVTILLPIF